MFNFAARAFPLILLTMLTALALWLDRATTLPGIINHNADKTPDLTVAGVAAQGFDLNGKLLYDLQATTMQHYPKGDVSDLTMATLVRTMPGTPTLTVKGKTAHVTERGHEITFQEDVTMVRAPAPGSQALTVNTSSLWLDTRLGLARSESPTTAITDTEHMQARGFDYDHQAAKLRTHAEGSIEYVRKKH